MLIRNFTVLFYIGFFMFLSTSSLYALKTRVLYFTSSIEKKSALAVSVERLLVDENLSIVDKIAFIQNSIREELVEADNLILVAEGFNATLMTIAQGNMLLYYRQNIKGLVLKNSRANYYKQCKEVNASNNICDEIKAFHHDTLLAQASADELLKALSPAYQLDLYTPKILLVDENKTRLNEWEEALQSNNIVYLKVKEANQNLKKFFKIKNSCKLQPKNLKLKPNYFGSLLRYHLWKISYSPKNELVEKKEIAYGTHPLKKYDVFYKKRFSKNSPSLKNPLLIYVHGGGWTQGDKLSFHDFCRQYADKGFTAISVNYRLMHLPKVGMKEMVEDVKDAIEDILKHAEKYQADSNKTLIMAESAGAQLAFMAVTKLENSKSIKGAIFNSITTDLRLHSIAKQIRLSGIDEKDRRALWLDAYSPFNHLMDYQVKTLGIHSLDDKVVPSEHLKKLEIYSGINYNNISSLWLKNASHPISPKGKSVEPSYIEIQNSVNNFIKNNIQE